MRVSVIFKLETVRYIKVFSIYVFKLTKNKTKSRISNLIHFQLKNQSINTGDVAAGVYFASLTSVGTKDSPVE
jgi:hypothetical protein